jgi:hypothetical protein
VNEEKSRNFFIRLVCVFPAHTTLANTKKRFKLSSFPCLLLHAAQKKEQATTIDEKNRKQKLIKMGVGRGG